MTGEPAPPSPTGAVNSWDLSTGVDGPGTRFVVFTQGCPLRCLYCSNPETWHIRDGFRCRADSLIAQARSYVPFIQAAGGGATVSGGEPLLQPRFVSALMHGFKSLGLPTALDTSGFLGARADDHLLAATDLVLLDIKSWDRNLYRRLTSAELDPTLAFARRLDELGIPIHVRFVLVPGLTDDPANVDGVAAFTASLGNVERVDVLPLHKLALAKYKTLGIPYPVADAPTPSREQIEETRDRFASVGLNVV